MSKAFRLGLFIVGSLLIFSFGIFWIGSKQFLFRSTYRLNSEFVTVTGLPEGAAVRVGGLHEGTVKRIELPSSPDGKVKVVMDMKRGTRAVIKKDSVATIQTEGLVGDKFVEITFGSPEAEMVRDGDGIRSEATLEISDLMKKAEGLLSSANGAMQGLDATVNNFKSISSKINQGSGTVGALVNDRSVFNNVNAGAAAFQENMDALKHNFLLRGFFKDRGYESEAELTKDAIANLPVNGAARRFSYDEKIFDKPSTAKLKRPKDLADAGHYLESTPFGLAVVAAYVDMKGDTDKDHQLTQARASVVRDYLVQNFKLDDTKLKTIGLGKSADVNQGSRLDVIIYPPGEPVPRSIPAKKSEK